jgi:hypothetical protein
MASVVSPKRRRGCGADQWRALARPHRDGGGSAEREREQVA